MMTSRKREKHLLVFAFLLVSLFFPSSSYAQTTIQIPLEQIFKVTSGKPSQEEQTGVYLLEPLEAANPMPNDVQKYQLALSGNENGMIEGFDFSQEGLFSYKLYQQIPAKKAGVTYDTQEYLITVFVTSSADGVNAEVIVKNNQKLKVSAAAFTNTYSARNSSESNEQEEASAANASLPDTDRTEQVPDASEHERRLPRTGQLAENSWLIGLAVLMMVYLLYQRNRRVNKDE